MALIDKLKQVAQNVHDRKSYNKYLQTVLKAHGFTMKSAGIRMGHSQPYINHIVSCNSLTHMAVALYRIALFINVPPHELLYPLNSGLNAGVPYTYQGWKNQYINKVHDRKTLINSLHVLLRLNGYDISHAMHRIGHPINYLSIAIKNDNRKPVDSFVHSLAPLMDLSDEDCTRLVDNSGIKTNSRRAPHHVDSPDERRRYFNLSTYLKFMTKVHHDSIRSGAKRHASSSIVVWTLLHNTACNKHVHDNLVILKKIYPYLADLDSVLENGEATIHEAIHEYGTRVHDRHMFYTYVTAILKYHHIKVAELCRKLGHSSSYLYSKTFTVNIPELVDLYRHVAKVAHVDFGAIKKVAVQSGDIDRKSHHIAVRKVNKDGASEYLSVPSEFHIKLGTEYVVIKRRDGGLLYEPIDVYKRHKTEQSQKTNPNK